MDEIDVPSADWRWDAANTVGDDDVRTIIAVRRQLLDIDERYQPSDEEIAAAAGTTLAAVRRADALVRSAAGPGVSPKVILVTDS